MGWRAEYLPEHVKRIVDSSAVQAARLGWCEFCIGRNKPEQIHVHHVKSRGAGGGDVPGNLMSLCSLCHDKAHRAIISRARIMAFLTAREGLWRRIGLSKACRCGCERFRYLESDGAFFCTGCQSVS